MLQGMIALSEGFKIGTPPLRGEIPKGRRVQSGTLEGIYGTLMPYNCDA